METVDRGGAKTSVFTAGVIHGALLATLVLYGLLCWVISSAPTWGEQHPHGVESRTLLALMIGVSVVEVVVAFAVYRFILLRWPIVGAYVAAVVVRDALLEAAAMNGLLLAFMGGGLRMYLPFGATVAALFLLTWPRLRTLESVLGTNHPHHP